nr:outer membrane protein assembly factor BamA [Elusimicrobiota bacterium]
IKCKAEAYFSKDDKSNITVTYFIKEGNKITVSKIKLVGVVKERYKKIYKLLETIEGKILKQNQIEEDIQKLENYYKNNGYINVEISAPLISYGPLDKEVYITIFIDEKFKFKVDKTTVIGFKKIPIDKISENISVKKGDIYSQKDVRKDMAAIQELYGKKGYIRMQVRPDYAFDNEKNQVKIQYNIMEGPKVFVNNIYFDGNYVTKDYVIKREFQLEAGDPFDISKVRMTQAEIYRLRVFRDVQVKMLPAGSPDRTDLIFVVEEQKTGSASIGAGYSTQDKLVGTVKISQDNLFGRGQKLSLMWEFGKEKQNYRVDFNEPYLFNTPTPFSVSAYNTIRTRYYQNEDYKESRAGGSLSLGRHFTNYFTGYLKYTLEQVKIYQIDSNIEDQISNDRDTTSSLTPTLIFDTRDYPFNPRKGIFMRASNQIAGGLLGGTENFLKFESKATFFKPVWKKLTGVLNLETGLVSPYSDTSQVPVYERFDVGGAESVRGYESWGDIGAPEGGNYKLTMNAEIKFPIFSEQGQTILQGAFFYDVGSTWRYFNSINLESGLGTSNLKRGMGMGIRFKTRAFPIRLDWGYGIDKRPKDWSWYFTLGDIF